MSGSSRPTPRWISPATDQTDTQMSAEGLQRIRALFQMRRPLPVEDGTRRSAPAITVRAFRPETDTADFLLVNNRAFSWHPDQGGWTEADLAEREAEPWFSTEGFLVHDSTSPEAPARIDGFCWTKVHPATTDDPAMGEIFVIAADPSTRGTGLGRALTLAGLDHLAGLGLKVGMLYVEHDNDPAVRLYEQLGFGIHHVDALYGPGPG